MQEVVVWDLLMLVLKGLVFVWVLELGAVALAASLFAWRRWGVLAAVARGGSGTLRKATEKPTP